MPGLVEALKVAHGNDLSHVPDYMREEADRVETSLPDVAQGLRQLAEETEQELASRESSS